MEGKKIQQEVAKIVCLAIGAGEKTLGLNQHLIDDLGADSFDYVDLVIRLENYFDIDIPDEIVEGEFTTVGSIVEYVTACLA